MENKNKPAFASVSETSHCQEGLTKLEYFTAMAMQGILANPQRVGGSFNEVAEVAKNYAEATLKALES